MSSHNEEHHTESKPVSFTVPFLMASALLLIIVLFLSLCDPSKEHHGKCADCKEDCSKECMEACERGDHSMHPAAAAESKEEKGVESNEAKNTEGVADTSKSAAPVETKAEEAHH